MQEVQEGNRGSFSSTEQLFQNAFESLSYVITMIASRPEQFRYPVLASAAAVVVADALYSRFLKKRRGHLVHVPCIEKQRSRDEAES